jgi:large subunit ribosomal protein L29
VARMRELRDLGDEDLLERLDGSKEELFNLRFQLATGQLDNPMRIKQVRHEIAQMLTVLRERELERELDQLSATVAESQEETGGEEAAARGGFARRRLRRKEAASSSGGVEER